MKKIPKWLWVVIACSPIIVVALFYVIKFMLMLTYGAVAITDGLVSSYEKESEEKAVIESLAEKNKVYNNGNIDRVNYNNFTVSSDFPTLETNYAYYSKQGGGKHYFYCLSKDGERLLFSHESGGQVQVFDGYLYFTDGDSLIEYCFLNGEKKTVCDL